MNLGVVTVYCHISENYGTEQLCRKRTSVSVLQLLYQRKHSYLSLDARKLVFGAYEKVQHKRTCTSTEDG